MMHDATFYFANLGADVMRCISAAKRGDEICYKESLERAYHTTDYIRASHRPEAYEEALLMLRGLAFARATPEALASFQSAVNSFIGSFSLR